MQSRALRVKLLYHLFVRPLPGEEVFVVSLAEAIGVDKHNSEAMAALYEQLRICSIATFRNGKHDMIRVPGPKELRALLIEDRFPEDVLEPLAARRDDGQEYGIKNGWMQHIGECNCRGDGCRRFKVTWSGRFPASEVCSHALNPAAVYYVRCVSFGFGCLYCGAG